LDKIIDFLCKEKLTTVFYISLDGYSAEQHDFIRGDGKFERTISFIKKLVEYKKVNEAHYKIMINSLLHKKNYTDLIKWYEFLESLGVYGWRFTTGRVTGFFKDNESEIKILSKDCFPYYIELVNYMIQKHKKREKMLYSFQI
jgi:MoaA/NifB/PqqE/SkfB family radical SAM enzyme